jgi:hypothetical protein
MGTVCRCERCARTRPRPVALPRHEPDRHVAQGAAVTPRRCSRPACKQPAVYTLTYVYRDSTAVLGPLAAYVEPHCYDLCSAHADRLTAPRGWEVVRLPVDAVPPEADDLEALANAVREAARPPAGEPVGQGVEVSRRGHLRVLRSAPESRDRL